MEPSAWRSSGAPGLQVRSAFCQSDQNATVFHTASNFLFSLCSLCYRHPCVSMVVNTVGVAAARVQTHVQDPLRVATSRLSRLDFVLTCP